MVLFFVVLYVQHRDRQDNRNETVTLKEMRNKGPFLEMMSGLWFLCLFLFYSCSALRDEEKVVQTCRQTRGTEGK